MQKAVKADRPSGDILSLWIKKYWGKKGEEEKENTNSVALKEKETQKTEGMGEGKSLSLEEKREREQWVMGLSFYWRGGGVDNQKFE